MGPKQPGSQRCRSILHRCLAIQLCKSGHTPEDFWMYDSGYMIFQNFLAANAQCWWNAPLIAATQSINYAGHVAPGMLLVTGEPCALEVLRGTYARGVLKPPATYIIISVGDIESCIVTPTVQGQFTPLPEALCDIIMTLTTKGHSATIENLRVNLRASFPHMAAPGTDVIYDTLAQLMHERKIYQTSKGYFIVTPERRRSGSKSRIKALETYQYQDVEEDSQLQKARESRTFLMTNTEAVHSLYGEILTQRDGDLTHQCIQTNLADIICGGNPNDKVICPRPYKRRSASFPTPRSLERRHSLRLFGSSKRLSRCASTRSLSKAYAQNLATDSSSSEYQSTDSSLPRKGSSLLFRLFRRNGRSKQRQIQTYSRQFLPVEWFNSRTVQLHNVGTQTCEEDFASINVSLLYDSSEAKQRSSTLPRRNRRHLSTESNTLISSRDSSPMRRNVPAYSSLSLPRSIKSTSSSSSVAPKRHIHQSTSICINNLTTTFAESNSLFEPKIFEENQNKLSKQTFNLNCKDKNHSNKPPANCIKNKPRNNLEKNCAADESESASLNPLLCRTESKQNICSARSIRLLNYSPRSNLRNRMQILTSNTKNYKNCENTAHLLNELQLRMTDTSSSSSRINPEGCSAKIPSSEMFFESSSKSASAVLNYEKKNFFDSGNGCIIDMEAMKSKNDENMAKKYPKELAAVPASFKLSSMATGEINDNYSMGSLKLLQELTPEKNCLLTPSMNHMQKFDPLKLPKNTNADVMLNNEKSMAIKLPQNSCENILHKNYFKRTLPMAANSEEAVYMLEKTVSVGSLAFGEKKLNDFACHTNKTSDLKNAKFESVENLNSSSLITSSANSLVNILHKKHSIGSEPNLALPKNEQRMRADCDAKTHQKDNFFAAKKNQEDAYDFPSLTDLNLNFTSLAARKILQGVKLKSIETLVEIKSSISKENAKLQNNTVTPKSPFCTDYGLV